jgi:hypothetical protein
LDAAVRKKGGAWKKERKEGGKKEKRKNRVVEFKAVETEGVKRNREMSMTYIW